MTDTFNLRLQGYALLLACILAGSLALIEVAVGGFLIARAIWGVCR